MKDPTETAAQVERLKVLAVEMNGIVMEVGPKWIRLAHLRQEAQAIIKELSEPAGD